MKSIILAGGKGTRLWPLSREKHPKQFLKLFGESLFQKAVKRALLISEPNEIFIVTNKEYKFRVLDDLEELGVDIPKSNILLEPAAKNTLPAIYWGIKVAGNGKVAVLPSDHLIEENEKLLESFNSAEKLADSYLVTFGVKPTKPHTGYGYIKPGRRVEGGFEVMEFKEKPDFAAAREYVEKGYFWNSGMFVFNVEMFVEEVKKYLPEVYEAFESQDVEKAYEAIPDISVDFGLMERSKRVAMVPLELYWNDLGSFDAIYEVMDKDENKNAVRGEVIESNSSGNLVLTGRLTALVGIEDCVVVDTDDALLIAKKGQTQKVKEIYEILRERHDERAEVHRTAYRPWGSYTVLETGERYKIKRITVKPGKRLSLQRHYHRSEHWIVVKGTARILVDGEERILRNGESTFVPAGVIHRLENPGMIPLEVIEVQIGEFLSEEDIERLEDDFER